MRFKLGFLLITIFILTLTLSCVSANENATPLESDDVADLVVSVKTNDTNGQCKYNLTSERDDISWQVNVTSIGAAANNTTVQISMMDGLIYSSHNPDDADYNPETGIWNVGYLKANETKSLKIITRIDLSCYLDMPSIGHISLIVLAFANTSSPETNLDNNLAIASASVYDVPVYYTSKEEPELPQEHNEVWVIPFEEYNDYREITKRTDNRKANAKNTNEKVPPSAKKKGKTPKKDSNNATVKSGTINLDEVKTSNPLMPAILSLLTLAIVRFKKKF